MQIFLHQSSTDKFQINWCWLYEGQTTYVYHLLEAASLDELWHMLDTRVPDDDIHIQLSAPAAYIARQRQWLELKDKARRWMADVLEFLGLVEPVPF